MDIQPGSSDDPPSIRVALPRDVWGEDGRLFITPECTPLRRWRGSAIPYKPSWTRSAGEPAERSKSLKTDVTLTAKIMQGSYSAHIIRRAGRQAAGWRSTTPDPPHARAGRPARPTQPNSRVAAAAPHPPPPSPPPSAPGLQPIGRRLPVAREVGMLPQARYSHSKMQLTRGTPGNVKPLPCRLLAKDQPDERFRSLHNTFGAAQSTSPRQERLGAGSDRGLSTRSSIEASGWRPRQPAMARSRDAKVSSTALSLRCSGDTSGRNARCDLPLQIVEDVTDHPMRLHQALLIELQEVVDVVPQQRSVLGNSALVIPRLPGNEPHKGDTAGERTTPGTRTRRKSPRCNLPGQCGCSAPPHRPNQSPRTVTQAAVRFVVSFAALIGLSLLLAGL